MGRVRMVTRTIKTTRCDVQVALVTEGVISTESLTLSGEYTNAEKALKELKKVHDSEQYVVLSVTGMTIEEELYGMTEVDFLAHATVLPARTVKED